MPVEQTTIKKVVNRDDIIGGEKDGKRKLARHACRPTPDVHSQHVKGGEETPETHQVLSVIR